MLEINQKSLTVPLIQGGMGVGVSLGNLAGHVAKCGAMGVISTAHPGYKEDDFESNHRQANIRALKKEILKAQKLSQGKGLVAINAMVALKDYDELINAALESKVDAIISGAGLPLRLPELVKDHDVLIAPIVSSGKACKVIIKHWLKKYQRTPDFIVIEGSQAGGHLGFKKEDLENQIQAAINWSGALAIQYKGGVMLWPIAVDGTYITSPYGNRLHPIQGVYRYHDGIDIGNAGYGAPVIAAADGIVTYAGVMSGYGNCVMINHGDGIVTLYGHGQEIYTELGATVKQGDVIMAVGSTGNSTGPHLHFEVRKFGVAVDPIPYLQGDNTKNESNTNENTIINNNEVANVT